MATRSTSVRKNSTGQDTERLKISAKIENRRHMSECFTPKISGPSCSEGVKHYSSDIKSLSIRQVLTKFEVFFYATYYSVTRKA